jgi:hypothetical protein
MINSRQIIELIRTENSRITDPVVKQAYSKLIEKIEVLEDIELTKMFADHSRMETEHRSRSEQRQTLVQREFEKSFR